MIITDSGYCLLTLQPSPNVTLRWGVESEDNPCQSVTTVVDPVTGLVGFMATDGPSQGRYLGDASQGRAVDWDQESFFGIEIPSLPPTIPALVPVDDTADTLTGEAVTIPVLSNDGDSTAEWTLAVDAGPANGTATLNVDGTITYTPNAGFEGTDTFSYTATDTNGATGTATVTVTVTRPAPRVPAPSDDTAETTQDTSVEIHVLDNDGDLEGWTLQPGTAPENGTVDYTATTATYTPRPGYTGSDTFTYQLSDGEGNTTTATVTIAIAAQPPVEETEKPASTGSAANHSPANELAATGGSMMTPALIAGALILTAGATLTIHTTRRTRNNRITTNP